MKIGTRPAGFIIDVPVTLSVAVRGEGLTEEQAFEIARDYARSLQPSQNETDGYNWSAFGHPNPNPSTAPKHFITEVSLESSTEDSCEVLDELEAEDDEEDEGGEAAVSLPGLFSKGTPGQAYTEDEHWEAAKTLQRAYDYLLESVGTWTDNLQAATGLLEKHTQIARKVAFQMSEKRQGR